MANREPPHPDDWQVVEEALDRAAATCTRPELARIQDAKDRLARLREQMEAAMDSTMHQENYDAACLRADEAEAEIARLREREAQKDALIVEQEAEYCKERRAADKMSPQKADESPQPTNGPDGVTALSRAEAAEARVAEWEARCDRMTDLEQKASARVARLEEALREIAEMTAHPEAFDVQEVARRALAHEEETMEKDTEPPKEDLTYWAWTIIANVSEGDWTKQTQEWQDAATRWRDRWHESLPTGRVLAHEEEK